MNPNAGRLGFLGVQPGEERTAALMTAHSFFMGVSTVFFETAASALFLARFEKQHLPWVYVAAALLNVAAGAAYTKARERTGFRQLMVGTLGVLFVSVLCVRLGLAISDAAWLVFGALVWYRVLSILTDLEYWAVAARIYDVRQAKRLFGLVGSGEVVARILGSFSVPLFVAFVGVPNLLLLSAAGLLGCVALLVAVLKRHEAAAPLAAPTRRGRRAAPGSLRSQLRAVLADPYLAIVVGLAVLAVFGKYFVDFAFLEQMQSRYRDVGNLAGFFGIFSGATQALSLLTRVFLSGPLLTRYGIRVGLLVLPLTHVLCSLALVAAGGEPALLFWLVIANQGIYKTLKHPIDNPSFKVLYQPLKSEQRLAAQIAVETIFTPVTIGVAGGVMLLFSAVLEYDPARFAWVLLASFAAWVWLARRAAAAYGRSLLDVLKRRLLLDDEAAAALHDGTSVELMRTKLGSEQPEEVLFALHMLEQAEYPGLGDALIESLEHRDAGVRRYALERLGALAVAAAIAPIRRRLAGEDDAAVRGAALRALARIAGAEARDDLLGCLNDPSPLVRRGAIAGLIGGQNAEARGCGLERLAGLARSGDASERLLAAQIAGECGVEALLAALARDPEARVRRAALGAAGRLDGAELRAALFENLAHPAYAGVAASALAQGGASVVPEIEARLLPGARRGMLLQLVRVLAQIGGPEAGAALRARLDFPDAAVRGAVLAALERVGFAAAPADRALLLRRLHEEAEAAAWCLAAARDLSEREELVRVRLALLSELEQVRERCYALLTCLFDRDAIQRARDNVRSASKDRRAYAMEILDITLPGELKSFLLPLLDARPETTAYPLEARFPQSALDVPGRLRDVLERDLRYMRGWTRATAVQAVGALRLRTLAGALEALRGEDPLIRQTAGWAQGRLAGRADAKDEPMLLIEKVMLLKGVQMFEETSEEILAEVAAILEEVEYERGEIVFRKGEVGDSMYVVVEGRVRVFDGERTLNQLGEREIFGELALLDPEPRSASVEAVADTRLFRLDRETFSELMAGNIEIVRGVLHVLCERLRRVSSFTVSPK
ncbi:MAG: Npt1/Npt2 family nucleotide transporter [Vicinamibacteria bacterium]